MHCVDYCLLDNFAWASSQQSCPWLHDPHVPSCGSICSLHSLQKVVFLPLPWSVKCPLLNLVGSPALCFTSQRKLRREGSFVYFCSSVIHLLEGWDPSMDPIYILNQKSSICIIPVACWADSPASQLLQEAAQILWCDKELDFSQPLWLDNPPFPLLATFQSYKIFGFFLITFDELKPWVHTEAWFKNHLLSVASPREITSSSSTLPNSWSSGQS